MSDAPPANTDLSALVASLQSDARDSAVFFRVLCAALTEALPDSTTVDRDHSLFKNKRLARKVSVRLGDDTFDAELGQDRIVCGRSHAVHGVGGGLPFATEMSVEAWTSALLTRAEQDARERAAATAALRSLTT